MRLRLEILIIVAEVLNEGSIYVMFLADEYFRGRHLIMKPYVIRNPTMKDGCMLIGLQI